MVAAVDDPEVRWFSAYFWRPGPAWGVARGRGFYNARMGMSRGRIVIAPGRVERWIARSVPELLEYTWPAIVLQRFKPTGYRSFLIDVNGELGSCKPTPLAQAIPAVEAAGFEIVTDSCWGWEKPRPLRAAPGVQLPPSVLS